ncbi:hypothetical protein GCM10011297_10560 [Bacterioplanes sanyensis]|uniref:flagella synthesis protein FlgN n=1 Tax=Bacterioplanes sanyensis TaxID=1249553 RepID=UPI001677123F|nr:flagellar protein FlgN [Bacterioplanes sanyensis]GGY39242.1 hypothetical protein GCM10011297_10560 [Bacterioplanes sanyensis]
MSLNPEPLARYLHDELALNQRLQQLLHQEVDVLRQLQPEQLQPLQAPKQTLLAQIQQTANERLEWMTSQQLPHSPACLEHPDIANQDQILKLWQQLASAYDDNRQLSAQLTELVLVARHRTQQRLQILRGSNNDPHLYNEQGQAKGVNKGQGYVQA